MENYKFNEKLKDINYQNKILQDDLDNIIFYTKLKNISIFLISNILLSVLYNFNIIFNIVNFRNHIIIYIISIILFVFICLLTFYLILKKESAEFGYTFSIMTFEEENRKN